MRQSVNLDVLRSVAVTLVVVSHLADVLGFGNRFRDIGHLGYEGVFLFFIHTSLVLMMSLERLHATGGAVSGRFYIRRAFRIYPLSILTVLAVLALKIPAFVDPPFVPLSGGAVWANLLLVQNVARLPDVIGPFWSLPYEVQMYLLLPFLYAPARWIRSYRGALVIILAGFAARYLESWIAAAAGYHALLSYAPFFCMGVAAYGLSRRVSASLHPAGFAVCLALFILAPWSLNGQAKGWATWSVGTVLAVLLPHFRDFTSPLIRRASLNIAKYSYGVYLAHIPIMWFAFRKLGAYPRPVQGTLFLGLLALIPVLLYHLIEQPLIDAGSRIAKVLVAQRPAVVAVSSSGS
jgi:peptidoglycan/LPS O-acetylase OafA/YrhL